MTAITLPRPRRSGARPAAQAPDPGAAQEGLDAPASAGRPTSARQLPLPRADLLPERVRVRRVVRRLRRRLAGLMVLCAVLIVAGWQAVEHTADAQRSQLADARQQQQLLSARIARLRPVTALQAHIATTGAALGLALAGDIDVAHQLDALGAEVPSGVWLTSWAESATPVAATPAGTVPGAGPTQLATVSFSGFALTRGDLATWLDTLATSPAFSHAYLTSAAETVMGGHAVVQFTTTAGLTAAVLSHRASGALPAPTGRN